MEPGPVSKRKQGKAARDAQRNQVEEPAVRAVGLLGVMGGALFGGGGSVPIFAFTGALGARFRSGVGFVGVAHARIYASSLGSIQLYGIGPGIRFGNRSQLTLAATGTVAVVDVGVIRGGGGGLFSLLAHIAFVIGDHFTLMAQPTVDFDGSGIIGSITGGLGITF